MNGYPRFWWVDILRFHQPDKFDVTEVEGLNRTFYGIETSLSSRNNRINRRLNRTFYGIETLIILMFNYV